MFPFSKEIGKLLLGLVWLGLTVYGFVFVWETVSDAISNTSGEYNLHFSVYQIPAIVALLALMLVNWGIETIKWQWSVKDLDKMSFLRAAKATLVGVSVSTWMPNRLGEYMGKIFYLNPKHRVRGAISALYLSYTQIIATLFFGVFGCVFFLWRFRGQYDLIWAVLAIVLSLVIMLGILFFKQRIVDYARNRNRYLRLFVLTLARYSNRQAFTFIGLSGLRFIVFNVQFILALSIFDVQVPFGPAFLLISLIYGLQTVIPATALAGLGIRGTLSVLFLGYLSNNSIGILSASYALWTVNLLLPSFVGLLALIASPVKGEIRASFLLLRKSLKRQ